MHFLSLTNHQTQRRFVRTNRPSRTEFLPRVWLDGLVNNIDQLIEFECTV
jgi:hypothetical protein